MRLDYDWQIAKKLPQKIINQFAEYSPIVLQLLYNRNIISPKGCENQRFYKVESQKSKVEKFLNPNYDKDLYDPFLIKGMDKAVYRIQEAIKDKQKIAVFGDYDADGVCASALLYEVFKFLGLDPYVYIPHREKEGYGLNIKAIEKLAKNNIDLIITCDCGVRDIKEIKKANNLGIDVIVTDHHIPENKEQGIRNKEQVLPRAYAVLDPKRSSCRYPFKQLAGVGVAYKLACALLSRSQISPHKSRVFLKWLLDLVAIGTVADIVPLVSENRTLVKYGLIVLNKTKRQGLLSLIEQSDLKPGEIDTYSIGYILGPRLNASGRLEHAQKTFKLLVCNLKDKTSKITCDIDAINRQRQDLTDRIVEQAREELEGLTSDQKIIMLASEEWSASVAGIVAGKLRDEFYRPTLIIQKKKDISRGSARSIPKFNIITALEKCLDLLEEVGGHSQAAGFTYKTKNHNLILDKLSEIAQNELTSGDIKKRINIDIKIDLQDVNWELFENLQKFEPLGEGNPRPVFLIRNAEIVDIYKVGNDGQHLKLGIRNGEWGIGELGISFEAIGFNLTGDNCHLKVGDNIDIVFNLICNHWNGEEQLQLKIVDIKLNQKSKIKNQNYI